jgi:hypothetical protein
MGQNRPPPSRPADGDGYEHRRRSDPPPKRETHRRWYDSTKVHVAIIATIVSLMAGAMGLGYSLRDVIVIVRGTPVEFDRQREINNAIWQTINRQQEMLEVVRQENRGVISAIQELCFMQASTAAQRQRCRNITEAGGG